MLPEDPIVFPPTYYLSLQRQPLFCFLKPSISVTVHTVISTESHSIYTPIAWLLCLRLTLQNLSIVYRASVHSYSLVAMYCIAWRDL